MSPMTEERQAELVAEWLDQPPGTPPPEGVDPEVIEALIAVRPELALPARVTVDDILASVTTGPLAKIDQTSPLLQGGSSLAAAPEDAPVAGSSKARRGWGFAAIGGIAGVGVLLAAALALVVVAPTLMLQQESAAPMSMDKSMADDAAPMEEVAAAPPPPPTDVAVGPGRPPLAKPSPRPVAKEKEYAEADAPAVADLGDDAVDERLEELGYVDQQQGIIAEAEAERQQDFGFGFAEGTAGSSGGGLGLRGAGEGGGGSSSASGLAGLGKGAGAPKAEAPAPDGVVVGGVLDADDAVVMEDEEAEADGYLDDLAGADLDMEAGMAAPAAPAPASTAPAKSSASREEAAAAYDEVYEEAKRSARTRSPSRKKSSSKQDAAAAAPMEPMPIAESVAAEPAQQRSDNASDLDALRSRAWPSGVTADPTIQAALDAGDAARALQLAEQALAAEVGNTPRRVMLIVLRGDAHRLRGDTNAARRDYATASAMNTAR